MATSGYSLRTTTIKLSLMNANDENINFDCNKAEIQSTGLKKRCISLGISQLILIFMVVIMHCMWSQYILKLSILEQKKNITKTKYRYGRS